MIRLVFVGLLFLAVYWCGRLVERHEWADGRITKHRGPPSCPYCRAQAGFQRIVADAETYAICRACLRKVDGTRIRRRG